MATELASSACTFADCNRQLGHDGPHGFELAPGLVLAPHGGGEGAVTEAQPCELLCDCCAAAMTMRRYENGGGMLACTRCQQKRTYSPDGSSTSTVVATLYPSEMKKGSAIYREFVESRFRQWSFDANARLLLGLIDAAECDARIAGARQECDESVAQPNQPWWKRWFSYKG